MVGLPNRWGKVPAYLRFDNETGMNHEWIKVIIIIGAMKNKIINNIKAAKGWRLGKEVLLMIVLDD